MYSFLSPFPPTCQQNHYDVPVRAVSRSTEPNAGFYFAKLSLFVTDILHEVRGKLPGFFLILLGGRRQPPKCCEFAVMCNSVLHCVAVCCSVSEFCFRASWAPGVYFLCAVVCVAVVCCSVLQL